MLPWVDATYVINLDRDTSKYQDFNTAFPSWSITRFPAINGRQLPPDTSKYIKSYTWLSSGEIGCALSHLKLWEHLLNQPTWQRICIFEDDARTHLDYTTVLTHVNNLYTYLYENQLPEPDILYLGKALDRCDQYQHVYGHVYRTFGAQCTHAYIINRQGAEKLLAEIPYLRAIDMVLVQALKQRKLYGLTFHPSLFFQDCLTSYSTLRNKSLLLNNTCECQTITPHISSETTEFLTTTIIGLLAVLILFIFWFYPK